MHINRDLLLESARTAVADLTLRNQDLICVYLTGSALGDSPLIGGTTDIDLICVHSIHAPQPREVIALGEDYHLDIAHYTQSQFGQPKNLRTNAWLGSYLCYSPLALYDSQHWFEFTQAGVYAKFLQPPIVVQRVNPFIQLARRYWLELSQSHAEPDVDNLWKYIKSLELAGNALACLVGVPMTERRFILDLPARCEALERIGLSSGLMDLFCPAEEAELKWTAWLDDWRKAILAANTKNHFPVRIHALRIPYYEKAIQAYAQENHSQALWILLRTWTLAVGHLAKRDPESAAWHQFIQELHLGKDQFSSRLQSLDVYLEAVEETISAWSKQNGGE
jgi:hypothetical protein